MNNDLVTQFGLPSWPTWLKLLVALSLAVAVSMVLVLFLAVSSIQAISLQNVQTFIGESAAYHAEELGEIFLNAEEEINLVLDDAAGLNRIQQVLADYAAGTLDLQDRATIVNDLQETLLNKRGAAFETVILLNAEGQLVLRADADGEGLPGQTVDYSSSAAFLRGVEAGMSGETQVLAVDEGLGNTPLLDIVHIIFAPEASNGESSVSGYLVAHMTADVTEREILGFNFDFLNISSRLTTARGLVIDEDGVREGQDSGQVGEMFQRLSLEASVLETVTENGVEIVRYYTRIPASPFLFISEGMVEPVTNQIFSFFVQRGFALVLGLFALISVLVLLGHQLFVPPLRRISQAIQAMASGDYAAAVPDIQRRDEIGELAGDFADMRTRIHSLVTDLEGRIEARVRDVTATREISHAAATQRDLQALIEQVVSLLTERFDNIYHAQVYLVDSESAHIVLRASSGVASETLLNRGHRLRIGSTSILGRAAESGSMTLSHSAGAASGRHGNLLPDTRAQLAIPLHVGDRVIGVLDVHSKVADSFSTEQMEILQAMADQVALAIENARLYSESLRRLNEIEQVRQRSTMEAWHNYVRGMRVRRLESIAGQVPATEQSASGESLRQAALADGRVVVGDLTERDSIPLVVPIRLRGQLLGAVEWEVPHNEFDLNKVQLAQNLTDQLAVNLENARLFQESQRATQRERLVNEIASRLTSQNDIDQILQTAVREVGMALRSPQVSVRLSQTAGQSNGDNGRKELDLDDDTMSRSESI